MSNPSLFKPMALACLVGNLWLPADARSATQAPAPVATAAAAASSPAAAPHRNSPYAMAAQRQSEAASAAGHAPVVPPSMRRTRNPVGRVPPQ